MTHLIQILRRDLPSQYDVPLVDLCQHTYLKHGIYLDPLEDPVGLEIKETPDKIILVLRENNAS